MAKGTGLRTHDTLLDVGATARAHARDARRETISRDESRVSFGERLAQSSALEERREKRAEAADARLEARREASRERAEARRERLESPRGSDAGMRDLPGAKRTHETPAAMNLLATPASRVPAPAQARVQGSGVRPDMNELAAANAARARDAHPANRGPQASQANSAATITPDVAVEAVADAADHGSHARARKSAAGIGGFETNSLDPDREDAALVEDMAAWLMSPFLAPSQVSASRVLAATATSPGAANVAAKATAPTAGAMSTTATALAAGTALETGTATAAGTVPSSAAVAAAAPPTDSASAAEEPGLANADNSRSSESAQSSGHDLTTRPAHDLAPRLAHEPASRLAHEPAARSHELRSPVGTQAWAQELGARVTTFVQDDVQAASLRVTPEHLGPIEVHLAMRDGDASVWFGATHADTRAALEQSIPQLREMLAGHGLHLAHAGVSDDAPRDATRDATRDAARDAMAHAAHASRDDDTGDAPVRVSLGLVDLYA